MKRKTIFLFIAALVAGGLAYAERTRTVYVYVHNCPDNLLTKVVSYFVTGCVPNPSSPYCYYTVSVDLGPTTTTARMIASGGMGHVPNSCYIPE